MLEVLGIIILLLLVGISIGLHEIGHLVPAKRFGVKVTDYAIGFGPTIFKKQQGETCYHIKLIPLGGFIRMVGMYPPSTRRSSGRFADLINQARDLSAEEQEATTPGRSFYELPVRKRLVIMTGGPLMNLALATVLFTVVFSVIGVGQASNSIGQLIPCVPSVVDPNGEGSIAGCVDGEETPAVLAGLKVGDTIAAVDGVRTETYDEVSVQLRKHAVGETVTLAIVNGAGKRDVTLTMADAVFQNYDADGKPLGTYIHRPMIGFIAGTELVAMPISEVPGQMWEISVSSAQAIAGFPQKLWTLASDLITGKQRDPNGPISVVGISRLSGQVVASDVEAKLKVQELLGLGASLNLFLFLFNLVPLLPLDGGHAAAGIIEALRRSLARLRGRPDPGPLDTARALPLTYFFSVLLLLAGLLVIIADVVAPISFGN